jgi:16S rRNA (adenine1518-N6/adenine1519-N6)-dimethyltransferase
MDGGAARHIASLCDFSSAPRAIEIGAGTGTLTRALLEAGADLTALEIDPDLVDLLRDRADLAGARIVQGDALEFDYDAFSGAGPWVAAGNLPYNIATPLIMSWLEMRAVPRRIVVMVQRDVADRFGARPSTPAYGSLSVAVQFAMHVRRAMTLGANSFYPRPKVESAVVVMEPHATPPVTVRDRTFFMQVVRGAFAYRRKTLANSLALALGFERRRVEMTLSGLGLAPEIRGEQLSLAAFAALADALTP